MESKCVLYMIFGKQTVNNIEHSPLSNKQMW
jgi:hypothetical protein